ncbi:MAG: sigma-70 family RNA polymerase sigma factor [Rhodobacteraceae bacterium]|nr:sigma-70 family RNA polymerase sigma factor [Paracoccaceae bacterium]
MHDTTPQPAEAEDAALLAEAVRGDSLAARALAARLAPPVLRFAARMLGGDRAEAEDVTQEALLRLWRQAPDWRADGPPVRAWVYRVAANLCTDRLRRRARRGDVALDAVAEPSDTAASTAAARMMQATRAAALEAALADLPERQRQAVILRHIEGLSNPEIAQIMDTGVEAVESLTARGKRALQAALGGRKAELGYDDEPG